MAAIIDRYGLLGRLMHAYYAIQARARRQEFESRGLELSVDEDPGAGAG